MPTNAPDCPIDAPTIAPLLLDVRAAARALSVSERTLSRLTAAGEIQVVRIGRAIRFDPADLREFIERQKQDMRGGAPSV